MLTPILISLCLGQPAANVRGKHPFAVYCVRLRNYITGGLGRGHFSGKVSCNSLPQEDQHYHLVVCLAAPHLSK